MEIGWADAGNGPPIMPMPLNMPPDGILTLPERGRHRTATDDHEARDDHGGRHARADFHNPASRTQPVEDAPPRTSVTRRFRAIYY